MEVFMEQQKEQNGSLAVAKYIQQLRNNTMRYSKEMVDLVEEDIKYGLTIEQTQIYAKPEFEYTQMKIISNCLRKGTKREFIDLLVKYPKINGYQMQVALEFYEKGVLLTSIEEVMMKGEAATKMRTHYEEILKKMEEVKEDSKKEPECIKELIQKVENAVAKIQHQDERYEVLNQKLLEFENEKKEDEVREELVKKLTDAEANLSSQQDQLNRASSTIARLREQIEDKNKELGKMQTRIDTLEDKLLEKAAKTDVSEETNEVMITKENEEEECSEDTNNVVEQMNQVDILARQTYQMPIYYQVPIMNGNQIITRAVIDRTMRKSSNGITGIFSKLSLKKKSRQDIVKLVANGNLTPAQLNQIKNAMLQGLTEGQLIELINNNVSAEKMKEIIEIAVIENSMDY